MSKIHPRDVFDATPDFVYAVSLIAALEGAGGQVGHAMMLPYLGMARAELTDFGQRRPACYDAVHVGDLLAGLVELDERLTELRADCQVLQHSLRIGSAQRILRRGLGAVASRA